MSEEKEIIEKLDKLNERAEEIRKRNKVDDYDIYESSDAEATEGERRGARAGSEFLASILGGAIIGYGIDWLFLTKPWGMILFMILGFVSGTYRANATMQDKDEK